MRPSPDLFRRMVEASTDGMWMFDETGVTEYANVAMARMLGRTPEEMVGLSAYEVLDEVGQDQFRDHLADMKALRGAQENLECLFLRKDGSPIWTLVSYTPLYDGDQVIGWLHRVTDYSDRRTLLDRLQRSEESLAEAQRLAAIGSWSWDVAADEVHWSDELYRIYGLEPGGEALTLDSYLSRVHPDDREIVGTTVGDALRTGCDFSHEVRISRPAGEGWVRGRGTCEVDEHGQVVRMVGTAQDITATKRAELRLNRALARSSGQRAVAAAANTAADVAGAVRRTAGLLPSHMPWQISGAWTVEGAWGLRPLVGPDGEPVVRLQPESPPEFVQQALLSRTVVSCAESGCAATPVLVDGEVVAVVQLTHDEDDEGAWTAEVVEYVAGQLGLVAERERAHAELSAARDQALEASHMKSEFLATMSHEIRTPLNAVIGLNELLLRTSLDSRQRQFADGAQMAGHTLLGLINDILDFSKIEAGRLELESVDFEVRDVFEQTARLLADHAHQQHDELVVACHPDTPAYLRGDPVRLGQVLANLGSNAVKFTEGGEVVIHAHVVDRSADEIVLRVEVTDTGIGIPPDQQAGLFDAFTQADGSTTRRFGGSGLGLAISRRLVSAMGGELGLISAPGAGSTFWFQVPLGTSDRRTSAEQRGTEPGLLKGVRALVVDDNATNRLVLDEQLHAWDMEVLVATGADEALAVLREEVRRGRPVDVVLMDLCMPDVDGLDLARMIRADRRVADVTILLLSSAPDVDREELAELGIAEFLSKPVLHSRLYDSLLRVSCDLPVETPHGTTGVSTLGHTVLVVEDNPMNQMVAVGLLESLGYDSQIAGDGVEALEELEPGHEFAVVLMDCQMPRLDGYDATRALRARERTDGGRRTPVVAMTAAAVQGERERCLAAGMDDYLTKPVDRDVLAETLRRWRDDAPATSRPVFDPAAAPLADVLDVARLGMLRDLRKGDRSLLDGFVERFASSADQDVRGAREAAQAGSASDLAMAVHRLKGAALNLGLPRLGAACAVLEDDSEATAAARDPQALDGLALEVGTALRALEEFAGRD